MTSVDKTKTHVYFIASLLLLGGFFVFFSACSSSEADSKSQWQEFKIQGEAQGTTYTIIYYGKEATVQKTQVDSVLRKIDNSLSNWVPSSLLSQLNREEKTAFSLRDTFGLLYEMYEQSKVYFELSNGAFDPTVMPLVSAWGFGLKNREQMDSAKVDSLLSFVGLHSQNIHMLRDHNDPSLLILQKRNGVQLDFNAIAQGYSVDLLAEYLEARSIEHYMIELGGEMRVGKAKVSGENWKIGIDKPMPLEEGRAIQHIIELNGMSVATSGNYRKYYEKDGMRYSHSIDPASGFPVSHQLLSATVIAETAAEADAMATVFMVIGLEKSKAFLAQAPSDLKVYLIYQDENAEMQVFEN